MIDNKYKYLGIIIIGFSTVFTYREVIDYYFPKIQGNIDLILLSAIPLGEGTTFMVPVPTHE